jgi:hypothetical protein
VTLRAEGSSSTATEAQDRDPAEGTVTGGAGTAGPAKVRAWAVERGAAARGAFAFLFYALASIVLWGVPVLGHLASRYVAMDRTLGDPDYYRWALGWTPWALSHGHSPLFTDRVFAPSGTDLTWSALMPGPSLLAWPLTRTFGTLVSYNVLMLLAAPLAAWAAYLLCHRVTHAFWPSVAGGYLFGFSAYLTNEMQRNLNLVLVFPIPLIAYLVVRRVEGSLRSWTFVTLMVVVLLGLFLISTEVFATATLFGTLAFMLTVVFAGNGRASVFRAASLAGLAWFIVAMIVVVPYVAPALRNVPAGSVRDLDASSGDALGFVVPRDQVLVGGSAFRAISERFTAHPTEDGSYIGIAGLLMLAGFAFTERRRRGTWALVAFVGAAMLLTLGPVLHVLGSPSIALAPGSALARLPLFRNALPERFPVYTALVIAVVAAVWLARAQGRAIWKRWLLVAATAVMLLPNVRTPPWHFADRTPTFFSEGTYLSVLRSNETVVIIGGSKGENMLWQSVADYAFKIAGGYIGRVDVFDQGEPLNRGLSADTVHVPTASHLSRYLACHDVGAVVVGDLALPKFEGSLLSVGLVEVYRGDGVSVWRLPAGDSWVIPHDVRTSTQCPSSTTR